MNAINSESIGCQSYGIFWDIENCPIPANERASNVIQSIKQFIANNYEARIGQRSEPCSFYCSCDTKKLDITHVEALNRSGVDILHVNPIRALNVVQTSMAYKVNADSKLMESIQKYVDHHFNTKKCLLFVITGDIDFAPAIRSAKRRGFQVILLYGSNASQEIKNSATEAHSYNDIVDNTPNIIRCMFTDSNPSVPNTSASTRAASTLSNTRPRSSQEITQTTSTNIAQLSRGLTHTTNDSTIPPFIAQVQNTVRKIENQNKLNSKGGQQSNETEFDAQKIKTIEEVTQVERHVALRVLQSTHGDVELAINLLVMD